MAKLPLKHITISMKDRIRQIMESQKMTQQELAKKPRAKENTINPQINETVRTLKRKGWTIAEIAENMNFLFILIQTEENLC